MFEPALIKRIAIGKIFGLVFAAFGALVFSDFYNMTGWSVAMGVILWYIILGAFVGLAGVITTLKVPPVTYAWWWRGAMISGFSTLALVLMFFDPLATMFETYMGSTGFLSSPWLFVIEAVIFGFLCDLLCTKFAGEGRSLLD